MKKIAIIDEEKCVACGSCVKECPFKAISIFNGVYAVVNENLCVGCGKCSKICPADIIEIKERGIN